MTKTNDPFCVKIQPSLPVMFVEATKHIQFYDIGEQFREHKCETPSENTTHSAPVIIINGSTTMKTPTEVPQLSFPGVVRRKTKLLRRTTAYNNHNICHQSSLDWVKTVGGWVIYPWFTKQGRRDAASPGGFRKPHCAIAVDTHIHTGGHCVFVNRLN